MTLLSKSWGRNIIYTLLIGLAAAVVALAIELKRVNEVRVQEHQAALTTILALGANCQAAIDNLYREQVKTLNAHLDRIEKLEKRKRR